MVQRHQPGAGLRLGGAHALAGQVFQRLDLAAVEVFAAHDDVGVGELAVKAEHERRGLAGDGQCGGGGGRRGAEHDLAGRQQLVGARAALRIQVFNVQAAFAEIALFQRDVAGREKGVAAALAVDDAAQLGVRERDAPIEQADAGQRPGSGQHAAAGSEIGAVGHVVLGI
ncbi:hypothetical protein G6F57_018714 [Rhizopus arrhizus]|nr:hypothetical protein G6F57_018714 [Rhizopus arrhizus]